MLCHWNKYFLKWEKEISLKCRVHNTRFYFGNWYEQGGLGVGLFNLKEHFLTIDSKRVEQTSRWVEEENRKGERAKEQNSRIV